MTKFLDLRSEQSDPFTPKNGKSPSKLVGGKTARRDPSTITGITVHQTACVFGPAADRAKAHRRAIGIPAHAVAFRDGVVALPCPLDWYVYTSNGLNATTLGLEIEGIYPGKPGGKVWSEAEPTPLDALARDTARDALRYLVEQGRALGMPITRVYAHRQSNGQKPSDPGWEIWRDVVLDFGVAVLGLVTDNARTIGDGKPIPAEWDATSRARY